MGTENSRRKAGLLPTEGATRKTNYQKRGNSFKIMYINLWRGSGVQWLAIGWIRGSVEA